MDIPPEYKCEFVPYETFEILVKQFKALGEQHKHLALRITELEKARDAKEVEKP